MQTSQSEIVSLPLLGAATIEMHEGVYVVRDDLLPGGAKSRFVPHLIPVGTQEAVFGAPFCGGAPVALATEGARRGIKVTIFYAERAQLSRRQQRVRDLGANLQFVRPGYMTVVQARARRYAQEAGALFFPLGFDVPEAEEVLINSARSAVRGLEFDELWCASGSGMLARCLALAFPRAEVHGVAVGLASRWGKQAMPPNVRMHEARERFEVKSLAEAPFPCCGHYDRKAWAMCRERAQLRRVLMWNVMGDD